MKKVTFFEWLMWRLHLRVCPYCDGWGYTWIGTPQHRRKVHCQKCDKPELFV